MEASPGSDRLFKRRISNLAPLSRMKGQTDEDASEQEEGKGEEDTNREISLKAHSSYRELQHGLTKEEPYTEWMEWMSH